MLNILTLFFIQRGYNYSQLLYRVNNQEEHTEWWPNAHTGLSHRPGFEPHLHFHVTTLLSHRFFIYTMRLRIMSVGGAEKSVK